MWSTSAPPVDCPGLLQTLVSHRWSLPGNLLAPPPAPTGAGLPEDDINDYNTGSPYIVATASTFNQNQQWIKTFKTRVTTNLEFKNLLHFVDLLLLPLHLFPLCMLLHELVVVRQDGPKLLVQLPHQLHTTKDAVIVSHGLLLVLIELLACLKVHPVLFQLVLKIITSCTRCITNGF